MGKLLNTTYHDSVNNITTLYNNLVNNPFYNWNDKKPSIVTYYNINKDYSSLDPGSKIQYDNINDDSPIRYNRIYDFIIYGFDKIELQIENGEFGLESSEIEGDVYILPNTIIPYEGDYFEVSHIRDSTWLFIIKDVQRDTLQNGSNAFKLSYKLEYLDHNMILNKIKWNYRMIETREGTNISSIVRCEDYDIARIIDEKAVMLKGYYEELFYDSKVQTFIYEDLREFRFYDPFMIEFLIRNKILDNGEYTDYTYVDHKLDIPKTFSLDYDKTFFRSFEKKDKYKLQSSNHKVTYKTINSFGTLFESRYETYYEVYYEDLYTNYNLNCISDDLINRVILNNLYTNLDDNYSIFAWSNIIIKYFNDEDLEVEELNSLDNLLYFYKEYINSIENKKELLEIDSSIRLFYIIPLIIFCLEKYIEKVLSQHNNK